MKNRFKIHLEHLAVTKGYPSYSEWYDWVCRNGENPVVVAMQIEGINREAMIMCLKELSIKNYRGDGIEAIGDNIEELIQSL